MRRDQCGFDVDSAVHNGERWMSRLNGPWGAAMQMVMMEDAAEESSGRDVEHGESKGGCVRARDESLACSCKSRQKKGLGREKGDGGDGTIVIETGMASGSQKLLA